MRLTKFLLISAKCEFKKLVLNYIIPLVIILEWFQEAVLDRPNLAKNS
jgi:hypothetical protein